MINIEELIRKASSDSVGRRVYRRDYTSVVTPEELLSEAVALGRLKYPSFVIDERNEFAYRNLAMWLLGDPSMMCIDPRTGRVVKGDVSKGIYLAGATGVGKTVAVRLMCYLAGWHGIRFSLDAGGKELRTMAWRDMRADEVTGDYAARGELPKDLTLCIQDLGTEPDEVLWMGNRMRPLRHLLETRGDNACNVTIITSNLPMISQDVERMYGEKVMSRLTAMCNYLTIGKGDRRR